jgi:Nucleotidyl transferase AbiEii toxin, Type IV TA system
LQTFGVDTSKLAPETRHVWEYLSSQDSLSGFVLVGGTALTLRIGHRISEDLDFITADRRLPKTALSALVRMLQRDGFDAVRNDNPAAYEEFLIAGDSLHDHQQDFLINGVKVSFVAPYPEWAGVLESHEGAGVRVASLRELFCLKAIAAANRRLSRDRVDLYFLIKEHGFTLTDFDGALRGPGTHHPEDAIGRAFQNLCASSTTPTDPGYETLMESPPSREELVQFFTLLRDEYQTEQARIAFRRKNEAIE